MRTFTFGLYLMGVALLFLASGHPMYGMSPDNPTTMIASTLFFIGLLNIGLFIAVFGGFFAVVGGVSKLARKERRPPPLVPQ